MGCVPKNCCCGGTIGITGGGTTGGMWPCGRIPCIPRCIGGIGWNGRKTGSACAASIGCGGAETAARGETICRGGSLCEAASMGIDTFSFVFFFLVVFFLASPALVASDGCSDLASASI